MRAASTGRSERQPETARLPWWKTASVYQIYPLSFQDSNGDGFGDLPGLLSRVDYLADLGIGAVWLSPIYRSPMADFGYDVSDFTDVDPLFGTLDDFDRLVDALHRRSIRLLLDFIPNHTSIEHPWFAESRASRSNPKRDWYVWHDPAPDGGPPSNWLSRFGGSAWELDPQTGQYYYHAFLKEQPDLNWHNPRVREAMADVLRFWMRRGVDGFRVDASAVLAEDPLCRDDPPNPDFDEKTPPPERFKRVYTDGRPETLEYLSELRRVVDAFPGRILAGEVQGSSDRIGRFYGTRKPRFQLPLNYVLLDTAWDPHSIAAAIDRYLNAIPDRAWPDWAIGGHDKKRIASRLGPQQARNAAMLLFTLPGTPFFYAGDELGMTGVPVPSGEARDPFERLVPGYGLNRDPERAPMRWDAGPNAGFTSGKPWLPVGEGVETHNVSVERRDPGSMLNLYRSLIALRRTEPTLIAGRYQPLRCHDGVLLFKRCGELDLLIALNLSHAERRCEIGGRGEVRLSTRLDRSEALDGTVHLRPDEGVVIALERAEGGHA
ncbi:MAG TPA: alpha-amylase family glycosyl hydrolase [Xanthobacteraceae bacterium]|nr:alpha-amylase family glycosyl hydrolase [Xanthobacteraceae bacterium]